MRTAHKAAIWFWALAIVIFAWLFWDARTAWLSLDRPEIIPGYALAGLMVILAFFNARKRLSMVPLGRGAFWTIGHGIGGILAVALFFLHTGSLWPTGSYEQVLAGSFYLVSISGILGYWMQRVVPRRLTENGQEVIWERIPEEIAEIRESAEKQALECVDKTSSDTLVRHYTETLAWFFRRPRFLFNHFLGMQRGRAWLERELTMIERYLGDDEKAYLEEIRALAEIKIRLDFAYAVNGITKLWLLFHVPMAAAVVVTMIWHIILVHVYYL